MRGFEYHKNDNGDLVLLDDGEPADVVIRAGDNFAILYQEKLDPHDMATVAYHGNAELVRRRYDKTMAQVRWSAPLNTTVVAQAMKILGGPMPSEEAMRQGGLKLVDSLRMLVLPVDFMTQDIVEEINACLACSGRVTKLDERLTKLLSQPGPVAQEEPAAPAP